MQPSGPTPDMTVETVLHRWPAATAPFVRRRLACLGCPMARFCTLADVAMAYRLPPDEWLASVRAAAGGGEDEETGDRDGEDTKIDPDQ